jgi:hypothetical protein
VEGGFRSYGTRLVRSLRRPRNAGSLSRNAAGGSRNAVSGAENAASRPEKFLSGAEPPETPCEERRGRCGDRRVSGEGLWGESGPPGGILSPARVPGNQPRVLGNQPCGGGAARGTKGTGNRDWGTGGKWIVDGGFRRYGTRLVRSLRRPLTTLSTIHFLLSTFLPVPRSPYPQPPFPLPLPPTPPSRGFPWARCGRWGCR